MAVDCWSLASNETPAYQSSCCCDSCPFSGALNELLGLNLVGPYDVLSGAYDDIEDSNITSYHLHWRYFYDPPEFLTVIRGDDKTGYHMGYYR